MIGTVTSYMQIYREPFLSIIYHGQLRNRGSYSALLIPYRLADDAQVGQPCLT